MFEKQEVVTAILAFGDVDVMFPVDVLSKTHVSNFGSKKY